MDDPDPSPRDPGAPLYDPRYEHDACGIGFVADAGGRSRDRVLPLALAGLAALAHRGAFGADGESSDGAGVALPLDRVGPRARRRGRARGRPDRRVVMLFLPRDAVAERAARDARRAARSPPPGCRSWPGGTSRSIHPPWAPPPRPPVRWSPRPIIARPTRAADDPRPLADDAFERRLVVARRRLETAARAAGGAARRAVRAVGVGSDDRLQGPRRRAAAWPTSTPTSSPRCPWLRGVPPALRDEHAPDLAPGPAVPARSPTTARSTRSAAIASRSAGGPATWARRADRRASSPPPARCSRRTAPTRSRSTRALELLTDDRLGPRAGPAGGHPGGARRCVARPHPHVATLRRRTAGHARAVGRAGGHRLRRRPARRRAHRPQRPAARRPSRSAATGSSSSRPRPARCRCRRRDGPSRPARPGRAAPGRARPPGDPRGHRRQGLGRCASCRSTTPRDRSTRTTPRPRLRPSRREPGLDHVARYLVGLDAERARLDIKTMALEAHEPLWSMGDDTPTAGRARLDRPVADHLRQAFAQVTNPAIDPERERIVMDLRVELGRRPALLGGPPRGPRTPSPASARSSPTSPGCVGALRASGRTRSASLDATWAAAAGADGLGAALDPSGAGRPCARPSRASRSSSSATRALDCERLPIPSILAAGAVHTALTEAGPARPDRPRRRCRRRARRPRAWRWSSRSARPPSIPRLAVALAAELAGTRGAEDRHRRRGDRQPRRRVRGRAAQDPRPDGHQRRRQLHRRLAGRHRRPRAGRHRALLPDGRGVARPDDPGRPGRAPAPSASRPRWPCRRPRPAASRGCPIPGFARFRADGEAHLFSPAIAKEIQVLSGSLPGPTARPPSAEHRRRARPATARPWPDRSTRRRCRATSSTSGGCATASPSTTSRTRDPSLAGSSSRR